MWDQVVVVVVGLAVHRWVCSIPARLTGCGGRGSSVVATYLAWLPVVAVVVGGESVAQGPDGSRAW